ncbi:MAG: hypothetical protein ABI643_00560 [Candidatus Doudnabacteria bacterium]
MAEKNEPSPEEMNIAEVPEDGVEESIAQARRTGQKEGYELRIQEVKESGQGVKEQMKAELRAELKKELKYELKTELKAELMAELKVELKLELLGARKKEQPEEEKKELGPDKSYHEEFTENGESIFSVRWDEELGEYKILFPQIIPFGKAAEDASINSKSFIIGQTPDAAKKVFDYAKTSLAATDKPDIHKVYLKVYDYAIKLPKT